MPYTYLAGRILPLAPRESQLPKATPISCGFASWGTLSQTLTATAILSWFSITILFIHSTDIYWARTSTMHKGYKGKCSPSPERLTPGSSEILSLRVIARELIFLLTPLQSYLDLLQTLPSQCFSPPLPPPRRVYEGAIPNFIALSFICWVSPNSARHDRFHSLKIHSVTDVM